MSPTVAQAARDAGRRLCAAGIGTGAWDAELLLRHVLGWDRSRLVSASDEPLGPEALARFLALIAERERRRPLQHLTGTQAFWRHEFLVTPDVLIPRPSTEHVVEAALELLRPLRAPLVADVGTGSGCIALSLAAERPDAVVHAVDISAPALAVARENARRLGLAERVRFHQGDLLAPLDEWHGQFDLIASNPPYVDQTDAQSLEPEVVEHEPHTALFARGGTYAAYEALIPGAASALRPGGFLVLEFGQGMETRVAELCRTAALEVLEVRADLLDIPRVVVSRRSATR